MSKIFKMMHMLGLLSVGIGASLYLFTDFANEVSGMLLVASLIGVGLLIMAPYPVALVFDWAQKQNGDNASK
ncbi:hypothetical protein Q4601_15190 [Shewanella sp. 1_MG-2023]|jgi:hypothetical protein|uniref:Uncharacterized protein n=1 Tax=Shewanella electrodiphila TaxID=934143 RepID=A0ABT0KSL0_9GAMM|nr:MULTISPECIES: hypothetical protein [Shewanella]MCC4831690.1 hypothetical protein [Shewanella sp. 10N.7]MCL1046589.1 hypothetical protein [Shewanella electrodiphila]MDO6611073.1 hypothetical protein [Shewanella sp. 7_MG-2023]MDO6771050.1 hypothetical protein [Shewanella sp. 2_MG-2023]MDO6795652.1 hypothetical protein [Shewanella sp. 1_MG-2023]